MAAIFVRTVLIYVTLIGIMRFLGKRQIGEMQLSELITTFLLSELAAGPISSPAMPISCALIPIITLVCLEVFFSFLPTKLDFMKRIVDSRPAVIIGRGRIDLPQMVKMRMTLEDLLCELRLAGFSSPSEIDYAILEQNGKLSFFPKGAERAVAHPVIIDGRISACGLESCGKDEKWLRRALAERKISSEARVFLMTVDDSGNCEVILGKERRR